MLIIYIIGGNIDLSSSYSTSYRETVPVHMSDVQCSGTESRLIECNHNVGGSGSDTSLYCNYYSGKQSFFYKAKQM